MGDRFFSDGIIIYKQAVNEAAVFHISIQIRVRDTRTNTFGLLGRQMVTHKTILYGYLYDCIIYTYHYCLCQMRDTRNHDSLLATDTLT